MGVCTAALTPPVSVVLFGTLIGSPRIDGKLILRDHTGGQRAILHPSQDHLGAAQVRWTVHKLGYSRQEFDRMRKRGVQIERRFVCPRRMDDEQRPVTAGAEDVEVLAPSLRARGRRNLVERRFDSPFVPRSGVKLREKVQL